MFSKRTPQLILFLLALLMIFQTGCKKNLMTPMVEDFTRPVIWMNVFEMSFTASEAGENSSPQILKIKNSGINTLTYSISDDADWLSVSPPGSSSSGQINEHLVSIDKSGLAAQDDSYTAVITIIASESYNNPQKVNVSLTIRGSVLPQEDDPDDGDDEDDPPAPDDPPSTPSLSAYCSRSPSSGTVPLDVSFTGSASGGTAPYSYSWKFGDGSSSSSQNPSHTYNSAGTYTATLTVTDSAASKATDSTKITASDSQPPPTSELSASASASTTSGEAPLTVNFTGSASGGTAPYSYSWNFGDGGSSSSQNPSHTYNSAGTYTTTLTVTDSAASKATDSTKITASAPEPPPPPPASDNKIEVNCNPSSGSASTTVNVPISITGNENEIKVFGLEMTFDANMFEFQSVEKGSLTGSWAAVAGNETTSGTLKIGGFLGAGTSIPTGSSGTIAIVKLKVTGSTYPNGQQCQVSIKSYTDNIAGMSPEPASATFTLQK